MLSDETKQLLLDAAIDVGLETEFLDMLRVSPTLSVAELIAKADDLASMCPLEDLGMILTTASPYPGGE